MSLLLFLLSAAALTLLASVAGRVLRERGEVLRAAAEAEARAANRSSSAGVSANNPWVGVNQRLLNRWRRRRRGLYRDCGHAVFPEEGAAAGDEVVSVLHLRVGPHSRLRLRTRCDRQGWAVVQSRGQVRRVFFLFV